jgi:deoxycytidylate deaminase
MSQFNWTKWDIRYLELAKHGSSWSKDPSTQTGAVIVRP